MAGSGRIYAFSALLIASSIVAGVVWLNFDHARRLVPRLPTAYSLGSDAAELLLGTRLPADVTSGLLSAEPLRALARLEQRQQQQQQRRQQPDRVVTLKLPLTSVAAATFDERLYETLVANGVASPRVLRSLDAQSLGALQAELGVGADTMARVFGMMYGFRGNFHRKDYAFVVEPTACPADFGGGTIMFVFSLPKDAADRDRIRSTWARGLQLELERQQQQQQLLVRFIMGRTGDATANETAAAVAEESQLHGDLLVADFEEDYHNLTLKTLLMMRWTTRRCATARLLVKADADAHVVPDNFLSALERHCLPARRAFLGWVSGNDPVHRDASSKWYVPRAVYAGAVYPPFAHGPCYVVTVDLLGDLLDAALALDYLHLEDVFVSAVCVRRLTDVRLVPIPDFVTWDCGNRRTAVFHGAKC